MRSALVIVVFLAACSGTPQANDGGVDPEVDAGADAGQPDAGLHQCREDQAFGRARSPWVLSISDGGAGSSDAGCWTSGGFYPESRCFGLARLSGDAGAPILTLEDQSTLTWDPRGLASVAPPLLPEEVLVNLDWQRRFRGNPFNPYEGPRETLSINEPDSGRPLFFGAFSDSSAYVPSFPTMELLGVSTTREPLCEFSMADNFTFRGGDRTLFGHQLLTMPSQSIGLGPTEIQTPTGRFSVMWTESKTVTRYNPTTCADCTDPGEELGLTLSRLE